MWSCAAVWEKENNINLIFEFFKCSINTTLFIFILNDENRSDFIIGKKEFLWDTHTHTHTCTHTQHSMVSSNIAKHFVYETKATAQGLRCRWLVFSPRLSRLVFFEVCYRLVTANSSPHSARSPQHSCRCVRGINHCCWPNGRRKMGWKVKGHAGARTWETAEV